MSTVTTLISENLSKLNDFACSALSAYADTVTALADKAPSLGSRATCMLLLRGIADLYDIYSMVIAGILRADTEAGIRFVAREMFIDADKLLVQRLLELGYIYDWQASKALEVLENEASKLVESFNSVADGVRGAVQSVKTCMLQALDTILQKWEELGCSEVLRL